MAEADDLLPQYLQIANALKYVEFCSRTLSSKLLNSMCCVGTVYMPRFCPILPPPQQCGAFSDAAVCLSI